MLEDEFDARRLRDVFGTFPTGVVAVCGEVEGRQVGMVASSFVAVSVEPALIGLFMQTDSATWQLLKRAEHLGVSVLSENHPDIVRTMSSKNGDRFSGVGVTRAGTSAIFVEDAVAWMESKIHRVTEAGDHLLVLLEVQRLVAFDDNEPLVFHRSAVASVRR